ncbi:carboxypeptidase-like regulatory domain-containing protein [Pseudonocardia alni]|uniref:carboxypeptidase-like regulatory domain-containing protein n=1 Tax=Pseudonocardia alni TaxID=33907 RepID=UPI00331C5273
MSTWALLGLVVVVVLVAVGIAGFLRWGRGREDDVASSEGDRPRTVADLVDRRARGLDDGPRRPAPDPTAPPVSPVSPGSPEPPADDAPEPVVDEESPADREVTGSDAAVDDDPEDAVSATTPVAAVRPQEERPRPPAAEDAAPELGPSSSAPDITEAVGAADPTDELPAVPRVTPDVSAGPVGPPWSRGFKDGKPLEPVEPAPARRTPAPTPFVRRRPVADPAARTADEATAATGSGPDSSAPDISTPTSGTAVVGDASTTASEAPADASTAPTEITASTGVTGGVTSAGDAASAGEEADESVDEAPPAATTQSRAPFDPDLVRRVTALPSERTSVRAPADPDTEREFREARDRISTPHTWAGRVPEQAGAPETAGDTPPVSRIPSIGLAATGARAARETGDNPEPPPRPAPRVLRSARPGNGPRHLAPSLRGTSATDSGPDEDTAPPEDTVVSGTAGDAGSPAGSGGTVTVDRTAGAGDAVDVRGPAGDTDASVPERGEREAPTGDAAGAGTTEDAATDDVATDNSATDNSATDNSATDNSATDNSATDNSATDNSTTDNSTTGDHATGDDTDGNATPGITTGTDAADADAGGTNAVEGGADTDAPAADAPAGTDVTGTDAPRTDAPRTDEAGTDATEGATRIVVPLAAAAAVVAPVAAAATATPDTTVPAPPRQAPDEQTPREQGLQEQDPQAEAPTPDPTTPERPTTAPEAEETPVHAGPTTATRPDRAEDVSLSVLRTGPVPSAVVPDTAPQDVEVRVVDAADAPLPGAEVALRDRSGGPIGSATTDADGTAHVTAPGAGAFVVVARADGYLPGVATCTVGDDDAGTTLRLAAAAAVHGSAPAGTGVVLSQDGEPVASTTAAADGTYRLADLDPGRYLLAAGDGPGVEVDLHAGGDERRDLAGS